MVIKRQLVYESALVVLVPEAETLVSSFRDAYDPSAEMGIPAHITINYPFHAYEQNKPRFLDELKALFSIYTSFDFCLSELRNFPGVLYLAPEPEQPFIQLIQAVGDRFPGSPPYGGVHEDPIPHLTIADVEDNNLFERDKYDFSEFSKERLPIYASTSQVWLMDTQEDGWGKRIGFDLSHENQGITVPHFHKKLNHSELGCFFDIIRKGFTPWTKIISTHSYTSSRRLPTRSA